jgi:hypothetical protein
VTCQSANATPTSAMVATCFVSSSTWSIGGFTWSDRVVSTPSNCSATNTLSTTESDAPPAQYKISADGSVDRYYYNWSCAITLCPSGWSLPSTVQFGALRDATNYADLFNMWAYGGYCIGSVTGVVSYQGYYWARNEFYTEHEYAYYLSYTDPSIYVSYTNKTTGFQVRCVK